MRTKHTLVGTAIAAAIALNFSAPEAAAGHGDDLSSSAHRIDSIAHELEDEFRIHYRHLGAYRHLTSDVKQVISKIHHIDGLTHDCYASIRHIKADVAELDRLAHHLHDVVDAAECGRYGGHVDGDTRHVHSLLSSLNSSIHSMQRTLERMAHYNHDAHRGHGRSYDRDHRRDRGHGSSYRYAHGSRGRGVSYSYSSDRGFRIALSTSGRSHR